MDQAKNFAKGTVVDGIEAAATSLVLESGHGLRFPTAPFNAVIYNSTDYPDPSDDPDVEIVRVTAISTDTLTITRAQEGTADAEHNVPGKTYFLIAPLTAKVINADIMPKLSTSAENHLGVFNADDHVVSSRITDDLAVFDVGSADSNAGILADGNNGVIKLGDAGGNVNSSLLQIDDNNQRLTWNKPVTFSGLPTSNPAIAGALWNDGGTLKISAG